MCKIHNSPSHNIFNQVLVTLINPKPSLPFALCSTASAGLGVGGPLAAVSAFRRLDEAIVTKGLPSCVKREISVCLYGPENLQEIPRCGEEALTVRNDIVLPAHELTLVQLSIKLTATADLMSVSARNVAGKRTRLGSSSRQSGDP